MLSTSQVSKFITSRAMISTFLMVVLVTGISYFIFNLLEEREINRLQHRFDSDIAEINLKISERMIAYSHILKGGRGLFTTAKEVNRQAWHDYAASLELQYDYPGIQGVGFALNIAPSALAKHEREVNKEGFNNYHIWPKGKRDTYTGILFLEPFDWRNQRAFGYDMFSEPTRREAMERARDTGLPALSGRVLLVQETGQEPQAGTLLYVPVYKIAGTLNTVDQRRDALLGWVYSPYRMDNLIEGILGTQSEEFRLKISDITDSKADNVLYDKQLTEDSKHSVIHQDVILKISGRIWQLHYDALPHYTQSIGIHSFYLEFYGVLFIGILLILLTWNILNTQRKAETLAKELSESLLKSERQLHLVTKDSPVMIAQLDFKKRYTLVNKSYANAFGFKQEELIGKLASEILPDDLSAEANAPFNQVLAGNKVDCIHHFTTQDGDLKTFSAHYSPEQNQEGHAIGFVSILIDITKRAQAEIDRKEMLNRFEKISSRVPGMVYQFRLRPDGSSHFPFASDAIRDIYRLSPDDVIDDSSKVFSIIHPDDLDAVAASIQESANDSKPWQHEYRVKFNDGTVNWLHGNAIPEKEEDGSTLWHGFISNINNRKRGEETIHSLSQVVEQAGEAILITNKEGMIEYINPAFTELTGYNADQVLGKNPQILKSGKQPKSFYKKMWKTITKGDIWHSKLIDMKKDGSLYPAMVTISPIKNKAGDIIQFVCMQQDLSENEELENQFYQAQKMEALGTLVGGIAHDFNNMLAGITGNLFLAKRKAEGQPDVARRLSDAEELCYRSAEMIKQLLTFARKGEVIMKPLLLTSFIKETIKFTATSIPENIELQQDITGDEITINGDITQLHQVLLNLINNARDSLEGIEHPSIKITLETCIADDAFIANHRFFDASSPYAHLSVEDNGCGIPEKQLEQIFEPFFTTKQEGKGTGLGLAMSFGAIKTHNGYIEVKSKEGKGTTSHIYLPLLEDSESSPSLSLDQRPIQGKGETILLADDNTDVRRSARETLEELNYKVLEASDGLEAVDIFSHHQSDINLIITDVVMPKLGGAQFIQRVKEMNNGVKVIFMTGYNPGETLIGEQSNEDSIVSKPFDIIKLSKLIRQKLDT